ncbi:unnamed protein product [Didymodactylos carnosus]|uniref:Uncharacterized protein n=1 Tax=Didymodactylos carnosus TaxID=1234261 RepID=A0A816B018_9BILA|nr:unnamed protein product [Didymodactylos carnosus]CAF4483433.1 unnamed protein product [Didymodactylos carnosus]
MRNRFYSDAAETPTVETFNIVNLVEAFQIAGAYGLLADQTCIPEEQATEWAPKIRQAIQTNQIKMKENLENEWIYCGHIAHDAVPQTGELLQQLSDMATLMDNSEVRLHKE